MECSRCDYYKAHNCKRQCMDLPKGKTCADCIHVEECTTMFGAKPENNHCGFEPVRFARKNITDREHCDIINAACPYDHSCSMCRLNSDYEAALEKSRELAKEIEESA